uniref:Uncharacterized protein n=1 Tax=Amblyomma parvum TaxID=251391 RepID=A0A023FTB5_AMBPA
MLCYICAGNLEKLATCWVHVQSKSNSQQSLQELVEQVMMLRAALGQLGSQPQPIASGVLASLLSHYAGLLAAQGSLRSAINYLVDTAAPSLAILRDRICQHLGMPSPHFPFPRVDVRGQFSAPAAAAAAGNVQHGGRLTVGSSRAGLSSLGAGSRFTGSSAPASHARMASTVSSSQSFYQGGQQVPPAGTPVNQFGRRDSGAYAGFGAAVSQHSEPVFQPPVAPTPPPPVDPVTSAPHSKGPRSRYPSVHDPCVYNEQQQQGYGQAFYQPPSQLPYPSSQAQSYMPQPYSQSASGYYTEDQGFGDQASTYTLANSTTPQYTNVYGASAVSSIAAIQTAQLAPPLPAASSIAAVPSSSSLGNVPPPGWNDPPPVKPSTKLSQSTPVQTFDLASPITTPLVGAPAPSVPETPAPTFQGGYVPPPMPQFASQPLPSAAQVLPQQAAASPSPAAPPPPPKEKAQSLRRTRSCRMFLKSFD